MSRRSVAIKTKVRQYTRKHGVSSLATILQKLCRCKTERRIEVSTSTLSRLGLK